MSSKYDESVEALYQAPPSAFVAERQRLASQLKSEGDKPSAAALAKLARPSISAWVVNQLWWHARAKFEALFETASQLRRGNLEARSAHRQAIAQLSARARQLLSDGGHAVSENTVRRVEMTLSSLAASGSFAPEPAGALSKDRDPAGFEAFSTASFPDGAAAPARAAVEAHPPKAARKSAHQTSDAQELADGKRREQAAAETARAAEEAERQRTAALAAQRRAERQELKEKLNAAEHELSEREHAQLRAKQALASAEEKLEQARSTVALAEARWAALGDD